MPRHNPKAPYRRRGAAKADQRVLDEFLDRLARLGADDEMTETLRTGWADMTDRDREVLVASSDETLRDEIEAIYSEHEFHTTAEEDVEPVEELSVDDVPTGKVAKILNWIGDDPVRARLALDAEEASGKPRAGVVRVAESVIGA